MDSSVEHSVILFYRALPSSIPQQRVFIQVLLLLTPPVILKPPYCMFYN